MELRAWLEVALDTCDQADVVTLAAFDRALEVTAKAPGNFVTDADLAVESLVRDLLRRAFPDHGVLGEECGTVVPDAAVRWIIDPIDGTHSFMRHIPVFATLVAAEVDGEVQVGVVSAPALGRRWMAWRGGGAWEAPAGRFAVPREIDHPTQPARRPIRVSEVGRLDEGQIFHGTMRAMGEEARAGLLALTDRAWRDRGFGDFWGYMLLASGCGEAMIETSLAAWDLAAPRVIVEEAGGRMTDFLGRRRRDGDVVATNGLVHDEVLAAFWGHVAAPRRDATGAPVISGAR